MAARTKNSKNKIKIADAPKSASQLRFERFALESVAYNADGDYSGIGTLNEKRLHAIIKNYICDDKSKQEITVFDGNKKSRIAADVLVDNNIFEVQTGGFFPLRSKIARYLDETDYHVTVVAPVAAVKYLRWIDPESGSISERHKSPKKAGVTSIAKELYWIKDFLSHKRFSLKILLLEMEEYRMQDGWGNGGKRGSNRFDRVPITLIGEVDLASPDDYAFYFLPENLPQKFTVAEYSRATAIRGRSAYSAVKMLCELGLLEFDEKIGRAQGYRKV